MLNLNSTIDLDLHTFLHWWRRELSALIPENIKRLISERQGFLLVRAEATQLHLSYQLKGETEFLVSLERDPSSLAVYQELLQTDARLSKAKVVLRLTGQDALVRELILPSATKENLHQVIAYELDRYTPFKAEQVYFAIQSPRHSTDAEHIKVLLILTTRSLFNTLCKDVKALGISPVLADYEAVANDYEYDAETYNLLPDWLSPQIAKTPQRIHTALLSLAIALCVAIMVLPVWFEYDSVQVLSKKVQKAEKEAKEINALQSEIDSITQQTQHLLDKKNAAPSVLAMLNTLSGLMKDDTWLAYLHYSEGRLQIQGESPAAATLIALLENSSVFTNPAFVSPVTQDSVSKLENFEIIVEPAKKAVSNDK